MIKNTENTALKIPLLYKVAIIIVLLIPLLEVYPLFSLAPFAKGIVFRIMFLGISLFFLYDLFFKKKDKFFRQIAPRINAERGLLFLAPLFLLLWLTIVTIFSVDPTSSIFGSSSRGGGFLTFSLIILFGYFLYFIISKKEWNFVWNTVFVTGILASFLAIMQWQGDIFQQVSRSYATFGNATILGTYLAILVFPLLYFALKEKREEKRCFYGISLIIILFGVFLTFTRAAFLGIAVGLLYFILFYPKKTKLVHNLKIGLLFFLMIFCLGLYYVNTNPLPRFAEENATISRFAGRLNIENAFTDPRVGGFSIGWEALKSKPIIGYGPENFEYAFNRHYHPDAPFIFRDDTWWDKAHNILIEFGVWGGFPATLLILLVLGSLFWALRKRKENKIESHSLQATLLVFFTASFFTIDDFTIYFLFAIIIGQILSVCLKEKKFDIEKEVKKRNRFVKYRGVFLVFSLTFFVFFTSLNLSMLIANKDMNIAENYQKKEMCEEAKKFATLATEKENPMSFDLLIRKASIFNDCADGGLEKINAFYILKEASERKPFHVKTLTKLGAGATNIFLNENEEYFAEFADEVFSTVIKINPYRHEPYESAALIFLEKQDFQKAIENADNCLSLENDPRCYFVKTNIFFMFDKKQYSRNILTDPASSVMFLKQ